MRTNKSVSATRLLSAVVFFFSCAFLHAQYDNGSLVGTIRDKSGAAVVGAVVTITNNAIYNLKGLVASWFRWDHITGTFVATNDTTTTVTDNGAAALAASGITLSSAFVQ